MTAKLTAKQFHWLRWLEQNGGIAYVNGSRVIIGELKTNTSACVPFLHLVMKGYVAAQDGCLRITSKGRQMVNPFYRPSQETVGREGKVTGSL